MAMAEETPTTEFQLGNPLQSWFSSFRSDFKVSWAWFLYTAQSIGAIFWKFFTKLPVRTFRILAHFGSGLGGLGQWLFVESAEAIKGRSRPPGVLPKGGEPAAEVAASETGVGNWLRSGLLSFAAWLARLVAKTADLLSIGELIDLLTQVLKFNTRSLTEIEIQEARKVFGDSLSYWRIRIDEWSLIAHLGKWFAERRFGKPIDHMAVTVFSTIHFSRRIHPEPGNPDMAWLIHELTHVAQVEHVGSQIMGEAVVDQGREGYAYGGPKGIKKKNFRQFNREQQGDIAKDYYWSLNHKLELSEEQKEDYERLVAQLRQGQI
jgi:hypothetical protein